MIFFIASICPKLVIKIKVLIITLFTYRAQGRIQDLKKEGAQWLRGPAPKTFLVKSGDFLNNLGQKGVGVRPPAPPSESAHVGLFTVQIPSRYILLALKYNWRYYNGNITNYI